MTAPDNYSGFDAYVGADAMNAYMKGLAARLPCGGRAKSALEKSVARGLARAAQSRDIPDNCLGGLKWIMPLARELARERPVSLPACFARPRIEIIACELVSHSLFSVSVGDMSAALRAFDSRQGLTIEEIWLFPRQVKIELIRAYSQALRREIAGSGFKDAAFLQSALQSLRDISQADWKSEYESLCRAEKILARDEIYIMQDEPSKSAVRREVAAMSKKSGLGEWTVARHAARLAENETQAPKNTCVYWLCEADGQARLFESLANRKAPVSHIDRQRLYISCFAVIFAAFAAVTIKLCGAWLAFPVGVISWRLAKTALDRLIAAFVPVRQLYALKFDTVPEEHKTLVVVPTLLSSVPRAKQTVAQLASLGAATERDNIEYLLLGDFRDSPDKNEPDDEAIVEAAREGVNALNENAGRKRYHYLHRAREYSANDAKYMARERKRGALMELNELILGREARFEADDGDESYIAGRFKYVLTLDADTRLTPDAQRALIGAIAHPLNRRRVENGKTKGFGVIVPRVEQTLSTRFSALVSRPGGLDAYPASSSSAYWDMCGVCAYCGKGVYEVRAFQEATAKTVPQGAILSHDLLEGALSGAGLKNDTVALDDFPPSLTGFTKRLDRWTRGDWQLLPFIFSLPLGPLSRFMALDNLVSSFVQPMALLSIILGFALSLWLPIALAAVVTLMGSAETLERAAGALAILPHAAFTSLTAICRALYRVYFSRRDLLLWTPAADAAGEGEARRAGKISAALLLPGIFHGPFAPFAAGLGLMFWAGEKWLSKDDAYALTAGERAELIDLARATWRYFDMAVPINGNGLPPDNVQLYPALGPAKRTSPTNISMYMLSCLAARIIGIISPDEATTRLLKTLCTLEALPKWRGQLYNWYDTDSLLPLKPRYVSSVDGGNLAAGLMLLANYYKGELGGRFEKLAREMELEALYDPDKKLFRIGFDESSLRAGDSRYDIMASESRILSVAAMALGKAPQEHWRYLGRKTAGRALLSWSGTAFEYLMPEIFMRSRAGSLIYESAKTRVNDRTGDVLGVWGVSESGYYAFDSRLNYQYRAFGDAKYALSDRASGRVLAPYAAVLAALINAEAGLKDIRRMREMGLVGEYGLYEAVDADAERIPENAEYMIVKSHMTHHQGMIMAALTEVLTDGALSSAFSSRPDVRAYLALLDEKPTFAAHERPVSIDAPRVKTRRANDIRLARDKNEGHLLYGAGTTLFLTGGGMSLTSREGFDVERFSGLERPNDGARTFVAVEGATLKWPLGAFSAGEAVWRARGSGVTCALRVTLSALDGAVYRAVDLENASDRPKTVTVYNVCALALCDREAYEAHPAFMNMFVKSEFTGENQATFTRRRGGRETARAVFAVYAPEGARVSLENDLSRLVGRRGSISDHCAFPRKFSFTEGFALDTCLCQKVVITLGAGEKKSALFSLEFGERAEAASVGDMRGKFDKSRELARARLMAELGRLSIPEALYNEFDAAVSALYLLKRAPDREGFDALTKNDLWEMGLDVTRPLIAAFAETCDDIPVIRDAAKRFLFYRSMGVNCLLALVNGEEAGYLRPVGEALDGAAAELGEGARVISVRDMSQRNRLALRRAAAIIENERGSARFTPIPAPEALVPDWKPTGEGGFTPEGYIINTPTGVPAPWCNVLANERFGAFITERAGGYCWAGNSRLARVTPWTGDALYEGELFSLRLVLPEGREISLVPVYPPAEAVHGFGKSVFRSRLGDIEWKITFAAARKASFLSTLIEIKSGAAREITLRLTGNFLMGADARDMRLLSVGVSGDVIIATGVMPEKGFLHLNSARESRGALEKSARLNAGEAALFEVILGAYETEAAFREAIAPPRGDESEYWRETLSTLTLETPDKRLNAFVSCWLPYQTISSRVFARGGFYQSGGAFGFRDQLQDMLVMLPLKPAYARRHILYCASRQFEAGDALHWWHPPAVGVRTRIADDRAFLPFITAKYVSRTGDSGILGASVPYLSDVPIPEGKRDLYQSFSQSTVSGTLHEHCMRAIKLSAETGAHSLALMRGGDWNDGMDDVNGESIWLSEFLIAVCDSYAAILGDDMLSDANELRGIARTLKNAVEASGWDGEWYRRAYYPDGEVIGSKHGSECNIDLVSQCWAALAGLDGGRCRKAMDEANARLMSGGVIRLLDPPFTQAGRRPGYISDYPPGVRENGGQYTHAACWAILAEAKLARADRAWDIVYALLPYRRDKRRYRAEPYALAADVYSGEYLGRAGWTWYTGAAAWLYEAVVSGLMGYEREGGRARLNALLKPDWKSASLTVLFGASVYRLTASRAQKTPMLDGRELPDGWVALVDDGAVHEAVFPVR